MESEAHAVFPRLRTAALGEGRLALRAPGRLSARRSRRLVRKAARAADCKHRPMMAYTYGMTVSTPPRTWDGLLG